MSNPAVVLSPRGHRVLCEIVKRKKERGERTNNGLYVETLIFQKAKEERIPLDTEIHVVKK